MDIGVNEAYGYSVLAVTLSNILDLVSSILVSRIPYAYERNPLTRMLMEKLGIVGGLAAAKFLSVMLQILVMGLTVEAFRHIGVGEEVAAYTVLAQGAIHTLLNIYYFVNNITILAKYT